MKNMTIDEFCNEHKACADDRAWALANCTDMSDVWRTAKPAWLVWVATRPGVLTVRELRLFACFSVRQVWHRLTDERSRTAVEVAERFANGEATETELSAARDAAWAAERGAARAAERNAARAAERGAARAAERNAARGAERAAARGAAWAAERDAALSAERDAAWAAAWDASWAAAWAAARDDAWDAARAAQADWLRKNTKPNFELPPTLLGK